MNVIVSKGIEINSNGASGDEEIIKSITKSPKGSKDGYKEDEALQD